MFRSQEKLFCDAEIKMFYSAIYRQIPQTRVIIVKVIELWDQNPCMYVILTCISVSGRVCFGGTILDWFLGMCLMTI